MVISSKTKKNKTDWGVVKRKIWRDRYIYAMLFPVIIYFGIFKFLPMYWLKITLYDYKLLKGFSGSEFVGLENFKTIFTTPDIFKLVTNTLIINIYALAFVFPTPIIFAILLNELRSRKFKKAVQTISYLPYFISMVILASIITSVLDMNTGFVNKIINFFGFESIYFLGSPKYFRGILVTSGIWQSVGFSSIIYLATLAGIDQEQYEAATVDGAGRLQKILHITLPSITTTIVILLILQIGSLMSINFDKVYLLQNNTNIQTAEVLQTYVYKTGLVKNNYSFASSVGLLNSFVSLILVIFANTFSKKFSEISLW